MTGDEMRVFLCEKPSQGKDIARVLGAEQRGEGCYRGAGVVVTWCIGHLLEAVPPEGYGEQYKRWFIEQLPILPERWRVEAKSATAAQLAIVKRLIAEADELVIATDADREGEMIAREILDLCSYHGPIQRLWLSALNEASIRQALGALKPSSETLPLYYSALARARADWLIGMNLSRLFTLFGRQAGYPGVLSVGRVQTPTLRLVVDREREIARFAPVPYWAIDVSLSSGESSFAASWRPPQESTDAAGRCLQASVAQHAADRMRNAGAALVQSIDTERVHEGPPLPFDLGTLQEVCSRRLGLGVQETLDIAQALYETHKATTYPRSDSGYLPEGMLAEAPTVFGSLLKSDPGLRSLLESLDFQRRSRAWDDTRIGAHHGILPTAEPVDLTRLNEKERAVYRLHVDRRSPGGDHRSRYDRALGTGAGEDRNRSDDARRFPRKTGGLGRPAGRTAPPRRSFPGDGSPCWPRLSLVRRAGTAAPGQERPFLVTQSLSRVQGDGCR
jgi:DNA topoisomerase-3